MIFDIKERTKRFAIDIINLTRRFPKDIAGKELGRQLMRSGTSIGANLEEADAASTRKDFFHRANISYKETKESRYWLEVILESNLLQNQSNIRFAEKLQFEAVELSKILYSIVEGKKKTGYNTLSPKATHCC